MNRRDRFTKIRRIIIAAAASLSFAAPAVAQSVGIIGTQRLPLNCATGQVATYSTVTGAWSCSSALSIATLVTTGDITSGAQLVATTNVALGGSSYFYFTGRALLRSPADGKWKPTNAAETAGVTLDFSTDSTLKLFARDGTSAGYFQLASTGEMQWLSRFVMVGGASDGKLGIHNYANTSGVSLDVTTNGVLKLFASDGTSNAGLTLGGAIQSDSAIINTRLAIGSGGNIFMRQAGNGLLTIGPSSDTTGVRFDVATADTLIIKAYAGGAGNLTAAGTITFAGLASSTGVRYVCANTTGVLDGQAAACVGTEATVDQFAKDGFVVLTQDEYQTFLSMAEAWKQGARR